MSVEFRMKDCGADNAKHDQDRIFKKIERAVSPNNHAFDWMTFFVSISVLSFFSGCSALEKRPTEALSAQVTRFALVQYPIESDQDLKGIIKKTEKYVVEAKANGADVVVFPEHLVLDAWPKKTKVSEPEVLKEIASQITEKFFSEVVSLSRRNKITILAGSGPLLRDGRLYNTAFMAFPNGTKVTQDKLFPTAWEVKNGFSGGKELKVFQGPWGSFSILICYDSEFPGISNALVKDQPEVLFIPSMTESKAGLNRVRWTSQARAVEHHAYVLLTGTVGNPTPSWNHYGQSAAITPHEGAFSGISKEGALNQPGITFVDLDLEKLRLARRTSSFYPAKHQVLTRPIKVLDVSVGK